MDHDGWFDEKLCIFMTVLVFILKSYLSLFVGSEIQSDLALFESSFFGELTYVEPCRNLKSLSIVDITDDAQATCARLMEENCNFIKTIFKYQLHFLFLLFFLMCNTVTTSVKSISYFVRKRLSWSGDFTRKWFSEYACDF